MKKNAILGVVRHVLTAAGGYFVSTGLIEQDVVQSVVAAVITIVGFAWSMIDKKDRAEQAAS